MRDNKQQDLIKQKQISIDPLSLRSLFIFFTKQETCLYSASGFLIEKKNRYYLITNYHVLSSDEQNDMKPDKVLIYHHSTSRLGSWEIKTEELYSSNEPRWIEHKFGNKIDVIALPLEKTDLTIKLYPLDLNLSNIDMIIHPAMPVSIIGFPLGIKPGFPIWKTGHIASDPDIDFNDEPIFLIDATTKSGMSGSPVFVQMNGGYQTKKGANILSGRPITKFLGIYSSRFGTKAEGSIDIGKVWKPHVISEILPD
jgi:hypothetical protein